MAKLYFRYGAMGASKTANALMVAYNYEEKGLNPLVLKPAIENRDGKKIIKSRIGLSRKCGFVEDYVKTDPYKTPKENFADTLATGIGDYDCIIVDECQFVNCPLLKIMGLQLSGSTNDD